MAKSSDLKPLILPNTYNYFAAFLTFACNLRCSYCINHFEHRIIKRKLTIGKDWVRALNRVISREDLPVTLQGGEPSLHPDFIYIINNLKPQLHIDILTNLGFDLKGFIRKVDPERIKRESPYASIRVSYHPEQMKIDELIKRVLMLLDKGFSVGIWAVMHPVYEKTILEAQIRCKKLGIDFRLKEFMGEYKKKLFGTYKYEEACLKKDKKKVLCKTTELLIDCEANVFRCHADLYAGINNLGSLLDPDFIIEDKFRDCVNFGHCNPCDIKVKTNRFQKFGHTSVEITPLSSYAKRFNTYKGR